MVRISPGGHQIRSSQRNDKKLHNDLIRRLLGSLRRPNPSVQHDGVGYFDEIMRSRAFSPAGPAVVHPGNSLLEVCALVRRSLSTSMMTVT